MNVLIADDDRMSRELLRRIVESDANFQVVLAEDGEEAWTHLSDESKAIEIAMLDIEMPKIDGLTLLERMRATTQFRSIPAILCTAAADRNTVARASSLSVAHYIIKPYAKNVVLAKLQTVRAELARQSIEDRGEVLERLGLDDETYEALVRAVVEENSNWLQSVRFTTDLNKFGKLVDRAAGLRGASEMFGLNGLVRRLGEIEFTLLSDSAASKGQQSPLLLAQLAPIFEALDLELKKVNRHLGSE